MKTGQTEPFNLIYRLGVPPRSNLDLATRMERIKNVAADLEREFARVNSNGGPAVYEMVDYIRREIDVVRRSVPAQSSVRVPKGRKQAVRR